MFKGTFQKDYAAIHVLSWLGGVTSWAVTTTNDNYRAVSGCLSRILDPDFYPTRIPVEKNLVVFV
jgi:hypothetical protein